MTPEDFVAILDAWTAGGGKFPQAVHGHYLTTAEEAKSVINALANGDLHFSEGKLPTPNLQDVVALLQSTFNAEVDDVFRRLAVPRLHQIIADGLKEDFTPPLAASISADWAVRKRAESYLFALKVAAFYGDPRGNDLIVAAARHSAFDDNFMWSTIFDYVARHNPTAEQVIEGLRAPLPDKFCRIAFLDFANAMAFDGRISSHPFDTDEGTAFLFAKLNYDDASYDSHAVSAVGAAPFLLDFRRTQLLKLARRHAHKILHVEADWAEARSRSSGNADFLLRAAQVPQTAARATRYLKAVGRIAPLHADPDEFDALRRASDWLSNEENFMGRAPDELFVIEQRDLHWPPNGDVRRTWLMGFRHDSDGEMLEGVVTVSDERITCDYERVSSRSAYADALRWDPDVYKLYDGRSKDQGFWQELLVKFNPSLQ